MRTPQRPVGPRTWLLATAAVLLSLGAKTPAAPEVPVSMPVDPARPNAVAFPPVQARFVRLAIHGSHGSLPCVDELEVYGADGKTNLALASGGAKASASSSLDGYPIHKIEHVNDGRYGNSHSWICGADSGWVQVELPRAAAVQRVVFSRDRQGHYADRVPAALEVQVSDDGRDWRVVKKVSNTYVITPREKLLLPNRVVTVDFPAQEARYVRLAIGKTGGGQPCVDELEIYGPDDKANLALASRGAKATASSCIEGFPIHQIAHLNDGKCGNEHSWIADAQSGWAQIELPETAVVRRVVFSRDRGGSYRDRMATELEVQLSMDGRQWSPAAKVTALTGVRVDQRLEGETPRDWACRVAAEIPGRMRAAADALAGKAQTEEDVRALLDLHRLVRRRRAMAKRLSLEFNPAAMRRAVADLAATYPDKYRPPKDFDARLKGYESRLPALLEALDAGDASQVAGAMAACEEMLAFQRDALLANPLVDFDEILLLKRKTPDTNQAHTYWQWGQKYGMTVNWSCDFRPKNPPVAPWWDEEIVAFSLSHKDRPLRTIFRAKPTHMIQHPELHFDADRLLFAMPGPAGAFQVFEVRLDGTGLRQVTTDSGPDIDNGDPCYLPDGRILFNSTRAYTGVPCEDGQSYVANLCITDADGRHTRMLTFDQESSWYPTLLANGRVLYTRYEYANVSHQFGRLLFQMNPDGTGQMEYYGSNSYWPNSIFYARPCPNHPTMVVGVVCGHHGPNRTGRLVLLDPARGRRETDGAVQTIPGYGKKVDRIVEDQLYGADWPKFVHPWPLSDKYFLASARMHPDQVEYGLYLVDVFDNMTEICRLPHHSLLEPIPLKKRSRPPVVPDRVRPGAKEATVYLADVYRGQGLRGVPRGTVKQLRLFSYNYVYRHTIKRGFGHLATPGVDGPWEPRYILGTVPVREDGSARFRVPANTPISVQPLDAEGRAVQLMRSWFTAMPGEVLSCAGCHEPQNTSPPAVYSAAAMGPADAIRPWRGPPRGFDFELEVQPVLDRYCVGCHDGSKPGRPDLARKSEEEKLRINRAYHESTESSISTVLTPAFIALHPYVRRPHAESNYNAQVAAEYTADTSPLVQMLRKGHHNVALDEEAWDRLITWIDLGAPDQGSWKYSEWGVPEDFYQRRLETLRRDAGRTDDVEWLPPPAGPVAFVAPPEEKESTTRPECPGWPFDAAEARRRQQSAGVPKTLAAEIAPGRAMEFVLVPAGEFVMGDPGGAPDERPAARVRIDRPFYMSRREVTNAQFAAMTGAAHSSGQVAWRSIDQRGEGYPLSAPEQPAVRVSWLQAMEFCRTLSTKLGRPATLPTEAQWEWACRAGSATPLWYGGLDDDFGRHENLSGREQRRFAFSGKRKWYLRDDRFDDGAMVTAPVGSYDANPWGLYDMAGNVSEWTLTAYRPYPYNAADGRNDVSSRGEKVVRGGSWYVRPVQARSAYRWKYPAWRQVFNVGFRVILPAEGRPPQEAAKRSPGGLTDTP